VHFLSFQPFEKKIFDITICPTVILLLPNWFTISRIDFFYLSFANLTGGCCGQLLAVVVVFDVAVVVSFFVLTLTVELEEPEPTLFLSLSIFFLFNSLYFRILDSENLNGKQNNKQLA